MSKVMKTLYVAADSGNGKFVYLGYAIQKEILENGEGGYFVPRGYALIPPPVSGENEVAVLNTSTCQWHLEIDYRGQYWYEQDGTKQFIRGVGQDLPENAMRQDPPSPWHKTHDGTNWIIDNDAWLGDLQHELDKKMVEIDEDARQHIEEGFSSDALGSLHHYDCRMVDQSNIKLATDKARITGKDVEYLAMPSGQFFQMVSHSQAELEQVMIKMVDHINFHRAIARLKKSLAVAAHNNKDIDAVKNVDVKDWK